MNAVLEKPKARRAVPKPGLITPISLALPTGKIPSTLTWELEEHETFASIVWRRLDEAEAVIRAYAEDSDNTAAWGVLSIIYSAIESIKKSHESPTADDCNCVSVHIEQAIGMMKYIVNVEADLLTDAGLTLLTVAKTILDDGRKGL